MGLAGPTATMYEQIGYSVADVMAKAVFGVLIWAIANEKSRLESEGKIYGAYANPTAQKKRGLFG